MISIYNHIKYDIYALQEKIISSRMFTTIILLVALNFVYATPLLNFAEDVGYRVNVVMFPFLICDLGYICPFLAIIIYYFSGVPYLKYSQMYCIIREGKTRWVIRQMIHIVMMSFLFMLVAEFISMIPYFINGDFSNQWNEVSFTLALTDKSLEYGAIYGNYDIIQEYTPYAAMITLYFFTSLLICFLGIFMFMLSLLCSRFIAICVSFVFEILNIIAYNTMYGKLLYVSPFSWTDLSIFGKSYDGYWYAYGTPTMQWCITVMIIVIFVMAIINLIRINHMSFNYSNED